MTYLDTILLIILLILFLCYSKNKMRLVEHFGGISGGISGGFATTKTEATTKTKATTRTKARDNKKKLLKICKINVADDVLEKLNSMYDSKFIINTKIDLILDKFRKRKNVSFIEIMKVIPGSYQMSFVDGNDLFGEKETYSSIYECPRCHKKKHTIQEVVRRSIDEPTVSKCKCLECGMIFTED